jgi:hypothetical protein
MNLEVKEHSAGTSGDDTNRAFRVSILVMSAYTRQGLRLLIGAKSIRPSLARKDTVVAVVLLDIDAALSGLGFISAFAGESIRRAQRNLVEHLDEPGRRVVEDRAANILRRSAFTPVGIG